jgi:hypothetical protein
MTANYQPLLDTRPFFIETKSATTRGEHNKPRDTARAMLDENVEVVRRMWDAFLSGDFDTALSCLACDIEWDGTNLPDGRVGRGHEAVLEHALSRAGQKPGTTGPWTSSRSVRRTAKRSSC